MEATQYQSEFSRSLAPHFYPDNVSPLHVGIVLNWIIQTAETVDGMKRGLYYNKVDRLPDPESFANTLELPFNMNEEVLHASLGMAGEMGEILEVILGDCKRERLVDECGDFLWYLALLFKNFDITFQEVFERNIEKLKQRYPEKFTPNLAVNRDLEAEAAVFG